MICFRYCHPCWQRSSLNQSSLLIWKEARCSESRLSRHHRRFSVFIRCCSNTTSLTHTARQNNNNNNGVLSISPRLFLSLWITQTNWPTAWCRICPWRDSSETERGGWLGTITMGADLMMCWASKKKKKSLISWEILSLANNLSPKTHCMCSFRKAQLDNYTQKYKYH